MPRLSHQLCHAWNAGRLVAPWLLTPVLCGCYSIRNSWLDPTTVGVFNESRTMEIRASLTLEDTPSGIPSASYPLTEDNLMVAEEQPISGGDQLSIEIYELRERGIPFQAQVLINGSGDVNLPVIGRAHAEGLTVSEFEDLLRRKIQDQGVLLNPQVTVNPLVIQKATYSIFGIGVSAADNAPLRAGTFPIRRPDLRILEAINIVGGLNEFVTEVYIFRTYATPQERANKAMLTPSPAANGTVASPGLGYSRKSVREEPAPRPRDTKPTGDEAMRDVLDVVETPRRNNGNEPADVEQPVEPSPIEELEPEAAPPYIYANGEWIRNPAYQAPHDRPGERSEPPTFDAPAPAVNWARVAGDTAYRIIVIPAEQIRTGDLEANIFVRPGDVIRIVSGEIGLYYVMGQVNRVGAFAFNAEPITLKSAIASAGGLASLAWPDRCAVYRRIGSREQIIQVDLDRIFAGQDPDFYIRRGDIINVGTHPFAPFLERIRAWTLPNPINNVGYSYTYARNFADIDSYAVKQNPANEPKRFPDLFP